MLHPYEIIEEAEWSYSFKTKHDIIYHAYFIDYSPYHSQFTDVFSFIIEPESDQPHPIDNQIAVTVIFILKQFFSVKERAMLMICDTLDGKEEKRKQLFNRWYDKYNIRHEIQKFDASAETEDYKLYVSIYINNNNENKQKLISAFYELVSNDFYPL